MTNDPKRIKDIFLTAVELTDQAAQDAYLEQVCGGDAELRERVETLLRSHDPAGSFLGTPAAAVADPNFAHQTTIDSTFPGATLHPNHEGESDDLSFLTPPTRPDSLGRIGHYEVLQVLGKGGFGIVFRAFDDILQRVVAVKVMSPQLAATSPARKRFLREARSSAQVRHENVVQVYEVGEQPLPHLAMEFIPGETLQQRLDRVGPLDVQETLRIGRQIAEGLAAAHATDLIHRDIKPANVLLEAGHLKVKITDFGLARAADDASMTQSGVIAGTPMYMAPEQALGKQLDQRADLFSLGSVLYQMASGRPPFRAASTFAVLKRVIEDTPRSITEVIPETPEWLCEIITKLLEKRPEDRFQSAQEVAEVLADCETQLRSEKKVPGFFKISRVRSPSSSGRWKWIMATVLSLTIIALALTETTGVTHWAQKLKQIAQFDGKAGAKVDPDVKTGWYGWSADAPRPAIAPFDAAQAKEHQKEWAAYLKLPVEYTNSIGMKFHLIPPGEFLMGSTADEIDMHLKDVNPGDKFWQECAQSPAPRHKVVLTQPFYLGVSEVTQADYEMLLGINPSHFASPGSGRIEVATMKTSQYPVEQVSWSDAAEFCAKLSENEKLKPFYFRSDKMVTPLEGNGYRLPTEAEWEFACRSGTSTKYWIGDQDSDLPRAGWYIGNSGSRNHATRELMANPFGLYDIHGNVWEWTEDVWEADSYAMFATKSAINPCHASDSPRRIIRGGAIEGSASYCASFVRYGADLTERSENIGFRVVLMADAVKEALKHEQSRHGWPADAPELAIAPFASEQAKSYQMEWAAYLKLPVEITNSIGMKFRLIPPGEFTMGRSESITEAMLAAPELKDLEAWLQAEIRADTGEQTATIREPFYLGVHEVTHDQFRRFVAAQKYKTFAERNGGGLTWDGAQFVQNPECTWNNPKYATGKTLPACFLHFEDAEAFCAWLSKEDDVTYALPTEAQWEFSCRGGTTSLWHFGNDPQLIRDYGWTRSNTGAIHPVGKLKANPFGLFDMHGNAMEMASDGSQQVLRSGKATDRAHFAVSSWRSVLKPDADSICYESGFRVAITGDLQRASQLNAKRNAPVTGGDIK